MIGNSKVAFEGESSHWEINFSVTSFSLLTKLGVLMFGRIERHIGSWFEDWKV